MSRRWVTPTAWILTVILGTVAGAWAASATLQQPDGIAATPPVVYTVREATVERVLSFTTEAQWATSTLPPTAASGTITTVNVGTGQEVEVGTELFTVDLRPAFAAEGSIPAFRDLRPGLNGPDIEQLQTYLTALGHYAGAISGGFDEPTSAAVRDWQAAIDVPVDGTVRQADLIYLPSLPAKLAPGPELLVGAQVSPGLPLLLAVSSVPSFTITLGADQADLVPLEGGAVVHHSAGTWDAVIATASRTVTGELVLELEGRSTPAVCGTACDIVPIPGPAMYRADLIAVPATTGPAVPVSALRTGLDGSVTVLAEDGRSLEVEIIASADGQAVIEGVGVGTRVVLWGGNQATNDVPQPSPT